VHGIVLHLRFYLDFLQFYLSPGGLRGMLPLHFFFLINPSHGTQYSPNLVDDDYVSISSSRTQANTANIQISTFKTIPICLIFVNSLFRANAHAVDGKWTPFYKWLTLSFIMHGVGDFLLGEDLFKPGLGSFLVAHCMNLKAFANHADGKNTEKFPFPGPPKLYAPFLVVLIIAMVILFAVSRVDEVTDEDGNVTTEDVR